MRVDLTTSDIGHTDNGSSARTGRGAAQSASQTEDPASAGIAVDRTQFSFDQTRIRSLTAQALSAPEVRQAKVSSLAQAIGSGEYSVDAGKIAGAMISAYGGGTH
jgi:flagellar biosynthesis anti-sigma factor FlgM